MAAAWRQRQHQRWRRRQRKEWRWCTARQRQSNCSSGDAAAGEARRWCAVRWWQRGCRSVDAAMVAAARQRDIGGSLAAARQGLQRCSVSGATKARRWCTVRWRQHGGSSAEAAADSLAPSANGPTQVPSNATDSPTHVSSSLVKEGGTTASTASLSSPRRRRPWRRPLRSPMRRRCR